MPALRVGDAGPKGQGLFAGERISRGTIITCMVKPVAYRRSPAHEEWFPRAWHEAIMARELSQEPWWKFLLSVFVLAIVQSLRALWSRIRGGEGPGEPPRGSPSYNLSLKVSGREAHLHHLQGEREPDSRPRRGQYHDPVGKEYPECKCASCYG